jgi:hypothetical protein
VSITNTAGAELRSFRQYRKLGERRVSHSKQGPSRVSRLAVRQGVGRGVSPTRQYRRGLTDREVVGSRIATLERRLASLQAFVDSETRARKGITSTRSVLWHRKPTVPEYGPVEPWSFEQACAPGDTISPRKTLRLCWRPLLGLAKGRPGDTTEYLGATVPCLPKCEVTTVA